MIHHLDKMQKAGITSLKIEGRMKTEYYVANVVNAYRMALNYLKNNEEYVLPEKIRNEVYKCGHRDYSCGFYFGEPKQNLESSTPVSTYDFIAVVLEDTKDGKTKVEMRNRFTVNDTLELLSKLKNNATIKINKMENEQGEILEDCKIPKQIVYIYTDIDLKQNEILRRKKNEEF